MSNLVDPYVRWLVWGAVVVLWGGVWVYLLRYLAPKGKDIE